MPLITRCSSAFIAREDRHKKHMLSVLSRIFVIEYRQGRWLVHLGDPNFIFPPSCHQIPHYSACVMVGSCKESFILVVKDIIAPSPGNFPSAASATLWHTITFNSVQGAHRSLWCCASILFHNILLLKVSSSASMRRASWIPLNQPTQLD